MTARGASDVSAPAPVRIPRLIAFYQDVWDDDGTVTGWRIVAWGLGLTDGSAISIPVEPPVRVTLWQSIDDAARALDAYVDPVDPRRTIDADDVQPLPCPTAAPPPVGREGAAAQRACPDTAAPAGRDGPLGPPTPTGTGPCGGRA